MNRLLKRAKILIDEFTLEEYGSYADFSDITSVPIAYTTDDNDDEIQVTCDLKHKKMNVFLNNSLVVTRKYRNLAQLIRKELNFLSFDLVYTVGEW